MLYKFAKMAYFSPNFLSPALKLLNLPFNLDVRYSGVSEYDRILKHIAQ